MLRRWILPYARHAAREAAGSVSRAWTGAKRQPVKVLGLQRTGTNYLEQLLRINTRADVLLGTKPTATRPIWKHALPSREAVRALAESDAAAVVVVKHPAEWLLSLDRPGGRPSWRRQMLEHYPDVFRSGRLDADAAMALYVRFYGGWSEQRLPLVRLEQLPAALPQLAAELGLGPVGPTLAAPRDVPQSEQLRPEPAALPAAIERAVARAWDAALMGRLGYARRAG